MNKPITLCDRCDNAFHCLLNYDGKPCRKNRTVEPTNYDLIISKTTEELAEWLADILNHCDNKKPEELCRMSCPLYKCCNDQPSDNIEDWLKAPADKEGE